LSRDGYLSVSGRPDDYALHCVSKSPPSFIVDGYVSDETRALMHVLGIRDRDIRGGWIPARE
jgi:hypothetical protein